MKSHQENNMTTILALGDSLTTGYGLAPEHSFASRLEQVLKQEGRKHQSDQRRSFRGYRL